jgi:DNA-binding transcriptional MerR regulator
MGLTLGQAAKAAGVSKTTLQRYMHLGKLSASRRDDGSYDIDPAEILRVFGSDRRDRNSDTQVVNHVPANVITPFRVEIDGLRAQLEQIKGERDDLRRRLDAEAEERRQVQARLTALLTDQRPGAQPDARRGWWRRWRGK